MSTDSLTYFEVEPTEPARATVVILHGLGADGNDFVPIAEQLDLAAVGPVRFIFPNAPVMPVSINGGYRMPAWYDIFPGNEPRREDEEGLRASQTSIENVLAAEKARGIPANRIVLAGFSQGCAMALMTGLRHSEQLAGIVGMSGYLPLAGLTADERHGANQKTPIFLAHGTEDAMVVLARGLASRDALQAMEYNVQWHQYPMEHSVCMDEIRDLNHWLLKVLA
jgi:phospholipase/carboxylesterase